MKKFLTGIAISLITAASLAQVSSNPNPSFSSIKITGSGSTGNVSATSTTATGTTALRTLADRANDFSVNVLDHGAKADGVTDDSKAINAAIAALKLKLVNYSEGQAYSLYIPPGNYAINNTINLTGLTTNGTYIQATGANFIGNTTGKPVVDMIGSRGLRVNGLHVYGSKTNTPTIGIQIGRSTAQNGCDSGNWNNVIAEGYYSFTAVYIMACETTAYYSLIARNNQTTSNTYGLVLDGTNYWGVTSQFSTTPSRNTMTMGFDEPIFINAFLYSFANNATSAPLWLNKSQNLKFINGYAVGAGSYNTIINIDNGYSIDRLRLDLHTETNGSLKSDFYIDGSGTANLPNFSYTTQNSHAPSYIFDNNPNITAINMPSSTPVDATIVNGTVSVFKTPGIVNASGNYSLPAGSSAWNLTCGSNWTGTGAIGQSISYCGNGAGLQGIVASLPSNISASSLYNAGGVTSVTVTTPGHFDIDHWCYHDGTNCQLQYAGQLPLVTISAPPAGGAQATAVVSGMMFSTATVMDSYISNGLSIPATPGSGYALNQILTMVGGTCSTQPQIKVTSINASGGITSFSAYTPGFCSMPPLGIVSLTGAQGSGATLNGLTWQIAAISVTANGSGYATAPVVSVQNSTLNATSNTSAYANTNSVLTVSSGNGQVIMNSSGTLIGIPGAPVKLNGILTDGTAVSTSLSGNYQIPSGVTTVRFKQTSTVASSTITMPSGVTDGQYLRIINYSGAVTSFNLYPVNEGWPNGATLGINASLLFIWDSVDNKWHRVN